MQKKLIAAIVIVLIGMCLNACGEIVSVEGIIPEVPGDGGTNSLMLSWTAPTTNEDETPLEDLAGYRLYYGTESGYYSNVVNVGNYTSAELSNLATETWYLAVTAYDYFGNESELSDQIHHTFST